jgi:hypothetical protein
MSAQLGLISPKNTHSNVSNSLYLKKGEAIFDPVLVAPVSITAGSTTAVINVEGNSESDYFGAINITTGESLVAPQQLAITAQPTNDGVDVWIGGNASTAVNRLLIDGGDGLSRVNDPVYNPQTNDTVVQFYSGNIPDNVGPGLWFFTPVQTGAYMLQVNFNIGNDDVIPPNGIIEWILNTVSPAGETQFVSGTIKSTSISKAEDFNFTNGVLGTIAPPVDYVFSNLAILTEGVQVKFTLNTAQVGGVGIPGWAIADYQVRLVKMC